MTLRERLRRVEQRLASLRDERAQARTTYDEAAEALAGAPDDAGDDHPAVVAAREAREALEAINNQIEQASNQQAEFLRQVALEQRPGDNDDEDDNDDDPADTDRLNLSRDDRVELASRLRTNLRRVVTGDVAQRLAGIAHGRTPIGRASLGSVADQREFLAALDRDDLAGLVQPDRRGLIAPTLAPLTFLDFLPFAGTNSNSVQYVQATQLPSDGSRVNPTAEGDLKPEMSALAFEDVDSPIRTIAAWTKQKKQVLDDAPFLEGLLRVLLVYEVRRSLSAEIISGSGSGEHIQGLLNHDILTYTRGTEDPDENIADALLWGVVEVEDHLREPSVIAMNPRDIARVRLQKDENGNYQFGPPNTVGARSAWDYPMIPERSLPEGTALVADPAGALGLLRSGVELLVSDSDQDDFIRNRVTLLAELRAGLAVLRPDAFCAVDIGTSAS